MQMAAEDFGKRREEAAMTADGANRINAGAFCSNAALTAASSRRGKSAAVRRCACAREASMARKKPSAAKANPTKGGHTQAQRVHNRNAKPFATDSERKHAPSENLTPSRSHTTYPSHERGSLGFSATHASHAAVGSHHGHEAQNDIQAVHRDREATEQHESSRTGGMSRKQRLLTDAARRRSENSIYRRAERYAQQRSFHQARALYAQLLRDAPSDGRYYLAYAKMEARAGNSRRACEILRLGVGQCPGSEAILLHSHAVLEERAGHAADARRLFHRCIEIDRNDLVSFQALALLEARQHNFDEAAAIFARGAESVRSAELSAPSVSAMTLASFWNAYGVFLQNQAGDLDKAATCFERATTANPQHVRSWQAWAVCEERRGEYGEARRLFETALRVDPASAPTYQAYGLFATRRGETDGARELFRRGLKIDSQHAPLFHAWARLEEQEGNLGRARKLFERGARVDPTNAVMLRSWACLEVKSGHIDSSKPWWRVPFMPKQKVPKRQLARYAERLSMVRRLVERKSADDARMVLTWLARNTVDRGELGAQAATLLEWTQRRSKQDVEAFTAWFAQWYEKDRRIVSYIFGWDIPPPAWEQDSQVAGAADAKSSAIEVPAEWYTLEEFPRKTLRDADDELFNDDAVGYSVLAEFFGTFASNLANRAALSCALLGFSVLLLAMVSHHGLFDLPSDVPLPSTFDAPHGVDAHLIELHNMKQ
uniref:Pre-mRNA-splicing factor Syf1/CRNKL1-like C-terminal HAT-repeats domain-containing protein n=1 Tax=Erythrolobus australicus TaxID=1077150 RepID=A0A7S1TM86_9RHOD|mmetsp:Transcript_4517/g.12296  ORF Transcript_4517/g.12296 Transcript_4517/m.12296 type:complete len:717 (+) Transcript_4517:138-2288(+)